MTHGTESIRGAFQWLMKLSHQGERINDSWNWVIKGAYLWLMKNESSERPIVGSWNGVIRGAYIWLKKLDHQGRVSTVWFMKLIHQGGLPLAHETESSAAELICIWLKKLGHQGSVSMTHETESSGAGTDLYQQNKIKIHEWTVQCTWYQGLSRKFQLNFYPEDPDPRNKCCRAGATRSRAFLVVVELSKFWLFKASEANDETFIGAGWISKARSRPKKPSSATITRLTKQVNYKTAFSLVFSTAE